MHRDSLGETSDYHEFAVKAINLRGVNVVMAKKVKKIQNHTGVCLIGQHLHFSVPAMAVYNSLPREYGGYQISGGGGTVRIWHSNFML